MLDNEGVEASSCAAQCEALNQCGDQIGDDARFADLAACETECGVNALLTSAEEHETRSTCIDDAACDANAIGACFGEVSDLTCEAAWASLPTMW